jgi:cytochrome P450
MTQPNLDLDVDALLMSQAYTDDRYGVYKMMRAQGPVLWVGEDLSERWMVTGYHEIQQILQQHDKFSSNRRLWDKWDRMGASDAGYLLIGMDPPEHTRVRAPFMHTLTPQGVKRYRPRIEQLVTELLDNLADRDEADFMKEFAEPLPLHVLAEMLGVPPESEDFFRSYTTMVLAELDVVSHTFRAQTEEIAQARVEVDVFFDALIEARRKEPKDDLISLMVQTESTAGRLTPEEMRILCVALMGAGLEPATYMLGNAVQAMFENPDQAELLRANPELIGVALEEFLRYDAPVHLAGRVVKEDVELGGQQLRQGQLVAWLIGAGNRDPEAFPDADRLELTRKPNQHLTFGHGIHRCLGAPVARLIGTIAIPEIVTRFPQLRPAGTPERLPNPHVHAFESLPVALT